MNALLYMRKEKKVVYEIFSMKEFVLKIKQK